MKTIITQVFLVAGLTQVVFKLVWHKQINLISHYSFYLKSGKKNPYLTLRIIYIFIRGRSFDLVLSLLRRVLNMCWSAVNGLYPSLRYKGYLKNSLKHRWNSFWQGVEERGRVSDWDKHGLAKKNKNKNQGLDPNTVSALLCRSLYRFSSLRWGYILYSNIW